MKTQATAEGRDQRSEVRGKREEGREKREEGRGHHALRSSLPAPRFRAFTLIEMLVVVAIRGVLATMIFPVMGGIKRNGIRTRARGEMIQLETAIQGYNTKFGHYPPDSGAPYQDDHANQLYYELLGTTRTNGAYQTLDSSAQIPETEVPLVFGANVSGFIKCNRGSAGDEAPTGIAFLKGLKPNQFLAATVNGKNCTLLGTTMEGPYMLQDTVSGRKLNPWRYNSSNPRYNAKSFDLWIDLKVGDKTNRICNWSQTPLVVGAPYP